jgi:tRNA threonylcarbamoyladenosine biosynthesis protein TsaB
MKILAFDTTNNNNDVTILEDSAVISQNNIDGNFTQAEMLVPTIEKCLNEAKIWYQDLDLIATIKGPGNFAGIRIGFSVATTMQLATQLPLVTINSLEALAYDYISSYKGILLIVLDARLDEFFIQEFDVSDKSIMPNPQGPKLIKYEEINNHLPKNEFLVAGSGKNIAHKMINSNIKHTISTKEDMVKAKNIALLAHEIFLDKSKVVDNQILYLREAKTSKPKK